jgi:hypothetical protein
VLGVLLAEVYPVIRQIVASIDRRHRANRNARAAVDALDRIDKELVQGVSTRLIRLRVDAVHGAGVHTRPVLGADAGFRDYIRHCSCLLEAFWTETVDLDFSNKSALTHTSNYSQFGLRQPELLDEQALPRSSTEVRAKTTANRICSHVGFRYHDPMSTPAWLPTAISGAGTIIALSAFAYQVYRARFNQSVDLLFRLENDFFGSANKRLQRAKAAHDLLQGSLAEAEPILDFFETMALLLKRGALDQEMVWHTFYYWIEHYYSAALPYIAERQRREPLVWTDLSSLVDDVRELQCKRSGVVELPRLTSEEISRFLVEEELEATL